MLGVYALPNILPIGRQRKKGYFESVCTTSEETSIKLPALLWTSSLAMHIILSCFNS